MAAAEEPETEPGIQARGGLYSRRRHRKGRFLKQGYHKSERDDARRVAARTFLSRIQLDSHLLQREEVLPETTSEGNVVAYSPGPYSISSRKSRTLGEDISLEAEFSATELTVAMPRKLHEISLELTQQSPFKLVSSKSLDRSHEVISVVNPLLLNRSASCIESPVVATGEIVQLDATRERRQILELARSRWRSLASPDTSGLVVHCGSSLQLHADLIGSNRVVYAAKGGSPFAMCSVLPYNKREEKLRQEYPHESIRARANSMSLQLELDGVELGTSTTNTTLYLGDLYMSKLRRGNTFAMEVSLAFLLTPLWVACEGSQMDTTETPPLIRKQSIRHSNIDKRSSTPRPLSHYHINPTEGVSTEFSGVNFPWQSFREHHTPTHVILNYHPLCLDNYEYFVGRNTTTVTPHGYRVSIIQYARASDIKKGINDQFCEVYPHIKLTLSKVRSVKREMQRIGVECDLDLAAVAYAHVYYEKLVLMGKITKPIRKTVAGACLLLAAKFFTDLKRPEINALIDKITDVFRLSSKELLLYEFPVLTALQFSLLTPTYQVQTHYDRLRELEQ